MEEGGGAEGSGNNPVTIQRYDVPQHLYRVDYKEHQDGSS